MAPVPFGETAPTLDHGVRDPWRRLLAPIGEFGGIVAMSSLERLHDGRYAAFFHDDGRFLHAAGAPGPFRVFQTLSEDGGLTWGAPREIASRADAQLCEPGLVRSPEGQTLALLLRENSRTHESFVIISRDEGASWSAPRELPRALTGDRHVARSTADGRLFVVFRDMAQDSPTRGDWVGWLGSFEDLERGTSGLARVRLLGNTHAADCGYSGLELLPDGTFVATSYGHWVAGEPPFIVSVRLRLAELDERLAQLAAPR
ncbi:MAG: exo-alpha-sialidase [Planctomycetes bacterium]|nr:exo-alpha-sialidase [Planctomycetota bacterium]